MGDDAALKKMREKALVAMQKKFNEEMAVAFPPKPKKTDMTCWSTRDNPRKIYTGNTTHWSKMRMYANNRSGLTDPASGKRLLPQKSFSDFCLEAFKGGPQPGDLSKRFSNNLKAEWTHGICYEHAAENFASWPPDKNSPFQLPPTEQKLITSITALPPHNLKRVMLGAVKIKKPRKTCIY